jgi:dCMP deaminase
MKQKWIDAYMDTAERFAQLSSATRLKVGSIIVKDNRIISIGYNGMPAGWDNVCEYEHYTLDSPNKPDLKTRPEVLHAEENAIIKLAKEGESGKDSTLFVTHAPCIQCAKLIYGSGIKKVYYKHTYRSNDGIQFLLKCGIEINNIGEK